MSTQQLQEEITHLQTQLAEYEAAVTRAIEDLGHIGSDPLDLTDALAQLDLLFAGEDLERDDLTGLAEQVRLACFGRARDNVLRRQAEAKCAELRAAKHDEDSAVLGHLLAQVRQLWNDRGAYTSWGKARYGAPSDARGEECCCVVHYAHDSHAFYGTTEAECLREAIRKAPRI